MKSTRFFCLDLMIKYTSKTMDVMDYPLVTRVNYIKKKTVILITIKKKIFCRANCSNFFFNQNSFLSSILNLKNAKHLKKYN